MILSLDNSIKFLEFGFGINLNRKKSYAQVPVDNLVQQALKDMVLNTTEQMENNTNNPGEFNPAETYGSVDYVTLSIKDEMAKPILDLHNAENIEESTIAVDRLDSIYAYYCKFKDCNNNVITSIKRSNAFKRVLKKRLLGVFDNTLKLIENRTFILDDAYDLIVHNNLIHILRPEGIVYIANMQKYIKDNVPNSIEKLSNNIIFFNFSNISEYASKHIKAAKLILSIINTEGIERIDKTNLIKLCNETNVSLNETSEGNLSVEDSNIIELLEVLDRRRYKIVLSKDEEPELYRALRRNRIKNL